jgi:hypothetical protein
MTLQMQISDHWNGRYQDSGMGDIKGNLVNSSGVVCYMYGCVGAWVPACYRLLHPHRVSLRLFNQRVLLDV